MSFNGYFRKTAWKLTEIGLQLRRYEVYVKHMSKHVRKQNINKYRRQAKQIGK
jgi:hypothetical protein